MACTYQYIHISMRVYWCDCPLEVPFSYQHPRILEDIAKELMTPGDGPPIGRLMLNKLNGMDPNLVPFEKLEKGRLSSKQYIWLKIARGWGNGGEMIPHIWNKQLSGGYRPSFLLAIWPRTEYMQLILCFWVHKYLCLPTDVKQGETRKFIDTTAVSLQRRK